MLLIDKYRPDTLDEFELHGDIAQNLKKLVVTGDCPHTLFYGPSGAGKKTLIHAFLRQIFGPSVDKLKVECKPWKIELPTRKLEVEFTTIASAFHVEMNPSDVGNNDRYVVQEIIKEMARNRPVGGDDRRAFRVLILNEVDRLTKEAQHSLRRTMEKYSSACRLVLCCTNVSKVIEPLRSRCLCVRVKAPTTDEIAQTLVKVSEAEGWVLPNALETRLATYSERNLRRGLLALECCRVQQYPFTDNQDITAADWEMYLKEIAADMLGEQSAKRLYLVRGKLYELLVNCIPPEVILRRLTMELMPRLDDELKRQTSESAAAYEHRLQEGSKAIFHLEAFVAKFLSDYKVYIMSLI